jgi:hypothetical protein
MPDLDIGHEGVSLRKILGSSAFPGGSPHGFQEIGVSRGEILWQLYSPGRLGTECEVGSSLFLNPNEQGDGAVFTADGFNARQNNAIDLRDPVLEIALRGRQRILGRELYRSENLFRRYAAEAVEVDISDAWRLRPRDYHR